MAKKMLTDDNFSKHSTVEFNHNLKELNHAIELYKSNDYKNSEAIFLSILKENQNTPDALHYLGLIAFQAKEYKKAINYIKQAIDINPAVAAYYNNCGKIYSALEKYEDAKIFYNKALVLSPNSSEIHYNLGNSCYKSGNSNSASKHFHQALIANPNLADAHNNYGKILVENNKEKEAITYLENAIKLDTNHYKAYNNLGIAYFLQDNYKKANSYYKHALKLRPDFVEAHNNLGISLMNLGKIEDAKIHFEQAIKFNPNYAEAHFGLGLLYLLLGNYKKGWEEYEWRYRTSENSRKKKSFTRPLWDGTPLKGKTLYIHTEQGLGDSIQFIRYIPVIAQYGGEIIIECDETLLSLFSFFKKYASFIVKGEKVPKYDVHAPLLSLPYILKTTFESIPSCSKYIYSDKSRIKLWENRLSKFNSYRVGLCWQGSKVNTYDRYRSVSLLLLEKIINMQNINFISLQKGSGQEQIKEYNLSSIITDYSDEINSFSDTAAVIDNLDLVITVDTAIAHLAGAMNKPVWVLTRFNPDWRWLLERKDTPWYPSMRLFRQSSFGNWDDVINNIVIELNNLISN